MADDPPDDPPDGKPTTREFVVCLLFAIAGVAIIAIGLVAPDWPWSVRLLAVVAGLALAWVFGTGAAGAMHQRATADPARGPVGVETNYAAPKPSRVPERRLRLRRSSRPPRPPRSGGTESDAD